MKIELKDWLHSINESKKNLIDEDPSSEKDYSPYIINRCLSGHIDCLMLCNEMNINNFLNKKLQYDFYINTIRTKKRYSPWLKKEKVDDLEAVKTYYKYSNQKAKEVLEILSDDQIKFIKSKLETGGSK